MLFHCLLTWIVCTEKSPAPLKYTYHFSLSLLKISSVFGLQQFHCLRPRCGFLLFTTLWICCTHQICDLSLLSILGTSLLIYLQILLLPYSLSPLHLVIKLHVNLFSMFHMFLTPFFPIFYPFASVKVLVCIFSIDLPSISVDLFLDISNLLLNSLLTFYWL